MAILVLPKVTSISPNHGPNTGGTSVTITGTNFTGATGATVGGIAITGFSVVNSTTITGTTASGITSHGFAVDVVVQTPRGNGTLTSGYTVDQSYPVITNVSPTSGPATGVNVTITGYNFTGATSASVYETATSFSVNSDTNITCHFFSNPGDPDYPPATGPFNVNVTHPTYGTGTLAVWHFT